MTSSKIAAIKLKIEMSKVYNLGCKDIVIWKFEFVAMTQILQLRFEALKSLWCAVIAFLDSVRALILNRFFFSKNLRSEKVNVKHSYPEHSLM